MPAPIQQRTQRRGATVVEFALCFPILLTFVFGTIEFSRVLQIQHSIRLAAFEGARAGVPLDSTTSDVTTRVQSILSAVKISNSTTTITPNPIAYTSPTVTVTVSADPALNKWVTWFVTAGHPLSSTITLNREVQAVSVP
jgi:Flp pilus assembly protein TadG